MVDIVIIIDMHIIMCAVMPRIATLVTIPPHRPSSSSEHWNRSLEEANKEFLVRADLAVYVGGEAADMWEVEDDLCEGCVRAEEFRVGG